MTVGDVLTVQWSSDGEKYLVDVVKVVCGDLNKLKCCLQFRDEIEGDNPRVVKLYKAIWSKVQTSSASVDEPPAKKKKTTPKEDQTDPIISFLEEKRDMDMQVTAKSDKKSMLDQGLTSIAHASLASNQVGEEVVVDAGFLRDADALSGHSVKGRSVYLCSLPLLSHSVF